MRLSVYQKSGGRVLSPAAAMVLFVVVFVRNGGYTGSRQRSPLVSKKVRRLVDLIDLIDLSTFWQLRRGEYAVHMLIRIFG